MPKFRVVIEDEKTGQEYKGYSALSRAAVERIIALIDSVGEHALRAGKLPAGKPAAGKNAERRLAEWARDVGHALDRKPPRAVPQRALTLKPRARSGR